MKNLATLIAAILALPESAFAQGTIDFHNPNTVPLRYVDPSIGLDTIIGTPGSFWGPASMRVGLFVGANGATSISQMTMVGLTTNSTSTVPLFIGTFNGGHRFTLVAHPPGERVSFAFAAWSISTGALTYFAALQATTGIVGATAIGQGYPLGNGADPPPTFGKPTALQPWLLNSFTFGVPEPAPIVLLLPGALIVWMFRRRRA
jgi:hypothetical protein